MGSSAILLTGRPATTGLGFRVPEYSRSSDYQTQSVSQPSCPAACLPCRTSPSIIVWIALIEVIEPLELTGSHTPFSYGLSPSVVGFRRRDVVCELLLGRTGLQLYVSRSALHGTSVLFTTHK
jgi:hypothetical protein